MTATTLRRRPSRFGLLGLLSALLLASCAEDPMGPENRFALIAFGQCSYAQALMLADQAIAKGNADNVERGLMLKAAILRDRGDPEAAEALYPEIDAAWQAAKEKPLSESRRQRDIQMFIDIAHAERHAKGLDPSCQGNPDSSLGTIEHSASANR
ncbi:hypothetical protein CKO42_15170 [Lamprobacter modestohalophilus]|uniref:Tetratricopeptide repeat protein n=1 Tax=Lamprobacter modestohalophilus TaxID=1064514 RepID=A0A9X0WB99_9GAMM|nr:hypothetical protein [Lamprobacter modestohalophilus]MBK1619758.1 hypothetical protein [Lamprobacter modestohalophilus]